MTAGKGDGADLIERVRTSLRDVPDFPKPGILFKDITPLLGNGALFAEVMGAMALPWEGLGVTHVAGVESRGFILGAPMAVALGAGFIPVRKPGKLPYRTLSREYALEYGSDRLEIHEDAFPPGARILMVDDVLATGGTAATACELLEEAGAEVVGCAFLLSIGALNGHVRLNDRVLRILLTV